VRILEGGPKLHAGLDEHVPIRERCGDDDDFELVASEPAFPMLAETEVVCIHGSSFHCQSRPTAGESNCRRVSRVFCFNLRYTRFYSSFTFEISLMIPAGRKSAMIRTRTTTYLLYPDRKDECVIHIIYSQIWLPAAEQATTTTETPNRRFSSKQHALLLDKSRFSRQACSSTG
jgi:hypothetical protein